MEVQPVDRLIELGLRPVLSHVSYPAGIRPRLDIDLVVTVVGSSPALSDELRKVIDQLRSRTVDDTVIVEAGQSTTFQDRYDLDSISVSLEAVSIDPPVEEVREMSEISNSFVSVNSLMDHQTIPVGLD